MKKLFAFVAVVGMLYGAAATSSLSSAEEAVAGATLSRAAMIEAATSGK